MQTESTKNKKQALKKVFRPEYILLLVLCLSANTAFAQSIPWQTPFQNLISWMGDTSKWVLTLVIVGAGLAFAIGEAGGFFRRCACAVLGGAIAVNAASWAGTLFGW